MNNIKKCALIFLLIFLFTHTVTGCWDNRDVTTLSIVSAIGLDQGQDKDLEVSFRIAKPIQGPSGGGQSSQEEKSSVLLSIQADTILEAIMDANNTLSREIFLTDLQMLIISEELAQKENIREFLDFFERDMEANVKAKIIVSRGIRPKQILEAQSEIEFISIDHLIKVLKNSPITSRMREVELFELFREKVKVGKEPFISIIQLSKGKDTGNSQEGQQKDGQESKLKMNDLSTEGVAVFKQGRMVGSLTPDQTWAALLVEGECDGGVINIPNPYETDKIVSVRIIGCKSKKKVNIIGPRDPVNSEESLLLVSDVKVQGIIGHQQGAGNLTTPEMVTLLEHQAAKQIQEEIEKVIKLTQEEYGTDIFGFGGIVYKKHLNYWKNIKDWNQMYSELPVQIDVEFTLKGSGYINKSMKEG